MLWPCKRCDKIKFVVDCDNHVCQECRDQDHQASVPSADWLNGYKSKEPVTKFSYSKHKIPKGFALVDGILRIKQDA
jgi:hypothetical protein